MGRKLKSFEQVHHINRNRGDNRPQNLVLLTRSGHNVIHKGLETKGRERNTTGQFLKPNH